MKTTQQRWAVAGAGMLGLTIAHRLAQQGHDVTVFESAPHPGGLADAWTVGDITWDRHYHVTLMSDFHVRDLWEELGLAEQMQWVETKTGFFTDGRLYSMSNTLEFLRFPPLRLIDKLRLGATIFLASKIRDWKSLERTSVADWLIRYSGPRTFEKIWLPLLRAKLGESWQQTSAAFIWATIARMYAARRSGLKKEMFGYVRGGYRTVLHQFERKLREEKVVLRCNTAVSRITRDHGRVTVETDDRRHTFDQVVCTLPGPVAARILPQLDEAQRSLHCGIRYHGIVCASAVLKRSLSPYYVTNITDGNVPFTAVIEMTSLVPPAELKGRHLIYLPRYVAPDDAMFEQSDEEIRRQFLAGLRRMYPDFSDQDVTAFRVSRARHVFALPTCGYSERVPPVRTNIPGVFVVNSSHIVNGTLNVNETVRLGNEFVSAYAGSDVPLATDPVEATVDREPALHV